MTITADINYDFTLPNFDEDNCTRIDFEKLPGGKAMKVERIEAKLSGQYLHIIVQGRMELD